MRARNYESWGRYPKTQPHGVKAVFWQEETSNFDSIEGSVLPYGYGRSYGDSCLNDGGTLIDMTGLRRFISFDEETGLLRCEAGVMLADILEVFIPRGWFLPVTPGTKFISIGGAIANDVHGKNHHVGGTFGRHVTQFELLRSNGERLICSRESNSELFAATIGGLGLTGLITWAEFRLRRIPGPFIAKEQIRFRTIDEFFDVSAAMDERYEYTVSWVDCFASGSRLGRGYVQAGNHDRLQPTPSHQPKAKSLLTIPMDAPSFTVNKLTVLAVNIGYSLLGRVPHKLQSWEPFFYPLDMIKQWNKLYGPAGFLQYQLVVPFTHNQQAIKTVLKRVVDSGDASPVSVLKTFGNLKSPGMLSFPRHGITLSLDFQFRGERTLKLLNELDAIVRDSDGALYPAKDARMAARDFQTFFPRWREFSQYVDPKFSSNFWRRVTNSD
ncbi:MAG: FAD-binding oxidoreductase [Anaerolineae bacterium]|nr:FAD-binding oxidoreductase [Anaerolineae bacterium]